MSGLVRVLPLLAAGAAALCSAAARADTVFSNDFECPTFNVGPLAGQVGWGSAGTVQTGSVSTLGGGARSVQVISTGQSGTIAAFRPVSVTTAGQVVTLSCDFRRATNTQVAAGVALFGDTGFIGQVGSIGPSYFLGNTNTGTPTLTFADGAWHRVVFTANFTTGTLSGVVDGASIGTLPINNATPPARVTLVQIGTGGSAVPQEIDFDNVVLTSSLPGNNVCGDSSQIFAGATPFSTAGATTDGPSHPECNAAGSAAIYNDIWYRYVPAATGSLAIDTCGANFDTKLAVYGGTCATLASTVLACNDDSPSCAGGTLQSRVSIPVTAGQTYLIRLGSFDAGVTGSGNLNITLTSIGGCCNARTGGCMAMTAADCQTLGLDFMGFGNLCVANMCRACPSDFNRSGAANVQDIFDFLASWFAGCP